MADSSGDPVSVLASGKWSRENWLLIGFFTTLTAVGVVISTGLLKVSLVSATKSGVSVRVPAFVYFYATFGAFGHVFTRLMTNLENFDEWGEIEKLAEMGLRVPAAWVIVAGVYLLLSKVIGVSDTGPRFIAGVAFLVGLYVDVAIEALGGLADRILGRSGRC